MCQVVFDETGVSTFTWRSGCRVFVATKYLEALLSSLEHERLEFAASTCTLVVHNGDILPDLVLLNEAVNRFKRVYAVNGTDHLLQQGIRPIPIGLENLHWARSGLLSYFPLPHEIGRLRPLQSRRILTFASFRESTNPEVRNALRRNLRERDVLWMEPVGVMAEYVNAVQNSVFVISPQGNGRDCHRTWEALYLGAVPVVTEGTLASSLTKDLPILVVSSWLEFLEMSDDTLREMAESFSSMDREKAYMPFWCRNL